MHNKISKRKQKHKASQSLKSKQQAPPQDALDLIGEELQNASAVDRDRDFGSNALILPANQKSSSFKRNRSHEQPEEQLSKSQLKKLKQVQLKKERREQLSQVLGQLHSSGLSDEHLTLLRPLHQRGAKETKKQRLRRALKLQRAGLSDLADAEDLLQERKVRGVKAGVAADGSSSSGEGGGSSSSGVESDLERPAKQARIEETAAAAAALQQPDRVIQLQQQHQQQSTCIQNVDQADHQIPVAGADQTAAAAAKDQLAALKAQVAALKAQARLEADGAVVDVEAAEEAAAARTAAAERAAAAAAGPTRVVSITRPPAMEEARRQLPIIGLEQEIMEGIAHNDVVVLCGETGSGKTTQVPQFLLEAGYGCPEFPERAGSICVTQPRRVAAISTAERVAAELGVKLGSTVGYQVRHDRRVGNDSAVRFMTDGVLMRQLQSDFLLRSYSVILLDEAHERSLNTDLLLGMLSRLVPLRRRLHQQWLAAGQPHAQDSNICHMTPQDPLTSVLGGTPHRTIPPNPADPGSLGPIYPLKIVIMSATLRTSDFTENKRLFSTPPPVLTVPTRQFPVTIHFSKHTELQDYLGAAVRKVCRIHRELPGGGILLFLTGQREVQVAVRRIRQAFSKSSRNSVGTEVSSNGRSSNACSTDDVVGAIADGTASETTCAAEATGASDDADLAAGADAAEVAADGVDAALEQDLLDAATGDALDDFDTLERDEDEEDVVTMGADGWTTEELAAAEARFEKVYGLSLKQGSNQGPTETLPSSAAAAPPAAAGHYAAVGASQQQQRHAAPVHVLPLYAMLPQAQQAAVFQPVPTGHRLIVVATNVAETSITIPGIRYVVDAGRSKQKLLEANSHGAVARYAVDWISKAAAEQRAGRAGRTGPGHVYRSYSSAHFNDNFKQHTDPEIANTSLEGVVLMLKAMGVDKVSNFPFPSPPEPEALQSATRCLLALSALTPEPDKTLQSNQPPPAAAAAAAAGRLTAVGQAMAVFPVTPRHSRMLLQLALWQQQQQGVGGRVRGGLLGGVSAAAAVAALPYAVALAAALSLESPFMHIDALQSEPEASAAAAAAKDSGQTTAARDVGRSDPAAAATAENKKKMQRASAAHARFRSSYGDAISSLSVLCAYEAAAAAGQAEDFCDRNFLHVRHLREMSQLRQQLGRILLQLHQQQQGQSHGYAHLPGLHRSSSSSSDQGSALQLLQCLMSAVDAVGRDQFDQPLHPPTSQVLEVLRRALAAGWSDQVSRRVRSADYVRKLADEGKLARHATRYMPASIVEEVYLHPRSCLASVAPEYVVYGDIIRTAKRPYMALVTAIEPHWLADCGSSLCKVSAPLTEPAPFYQPDTDQVLAWHDATYSQHEWPLPRLLLPHTDPKIAAATFAAALLAGKVLPAMLGLANALVAPAATAARPELAGLPRVGELVGALQDQKVFSRSSLTAVWQRQPQFLKQEVALWVQKQHRGVLDALWQQLVQEAAEMQGPGGGRAEQQGKRHKKKKKKK